MYRTHTLEVPVRQGAHKESLEEAKGRTIKSRNQRENADRAVIKTNELDRK